MTTPQGQAPTDTNTASGAAITQVLAYLDGLSDDAAAHIYPSDLEKCMTSECVVEVASVRAGNGYERTVPLFSREQVVDALASAPAQPVAEPTNGTAYAALPDDGEPWHGHRFKEVQHGCWKCDCGKTLKEVTADQAAPATGDEYPLMPRRYTVDDDGEDLFTAEKMRAFADATYALRIKSHRQAPAGVLEDAAASEVLMENSGCGSGTQVDMLTVRLNPGDKVIMLKGRITQATDAARKQGANHD